MLRAVLANAQRAQLDPAGARLLHLERHFRRRPGAGVGRLHRALAAAAVQRALAQSVVSCEGVSVSGHSTLARARLLVGVWLGGNLPIYCQSLESVELISKINRRELRNKRTVLP